MPTALFHLAFGLLLGAAVLQEDFDIWAALAIGTFVLLPDVDMSLNLLYSSAHRTFLHNIFVPLGILIVVLWDTRWRAWSFIENHWGKHGEKVLLAGVLVLAVAGIGVDMFGSGVNLFYPAQDKYYNMNGEVEFSWEEGLTTTIFDVDRIDRSSTESFSYTLAHHKEKTETGDTQKIYVVSGNGVRLFFSISTLLIIAIMLYRRHRKEGLNIEEIRELSPTKKSNKD